jgi:hypothetical protein
MSTDCNDNHRRRRYLSESSRPHKLGCQEHEQAAGTNRRGRILAEYKQTAAVSGGGGEADGAGPGHPVRSQGEASRGGRAATGAGARPGRAAEELAKTRSGEGSREIESGRTFFLTSLIYPLIWVGRSR